MKFFRKSSSQNRLKLVPFPSHCLLIDLSNSRAKFALANLNSSQSKLIVRHLPTASLTPSSLEEVLHTWKFQQVVVASVVPKAAQIVENFFKAAKIPCLFINSSTDLGIKIKYPNPSSIGADRLANVVAAAIRHNAPAIVVDFGTAITFDVIDKNGAYLGGIIAPGLTTSAEALHQRTALLPCATPSPVRRAVGKNTLAAIQAGLLLGARGLVREVVARVTEENFSDKRPTVIATGGDAALVARGTDLFDVVNPTLTLEGLREIGKKTRQKNFNREKREKTRKKSF